MVGPSLEFGETVEMVAQDPLLELARLSQAPVFIFSLTVDTTLRAVTI